MIPDVISTCMTSVDQDIEWTLKAGLSTEGKFYLGLNYRSEKPAIQVQGHANKMQPPGSR